MACVALFPPPIVSLIKKQVQEVSENGLGICSPTLVAATCKKVVSASDRWNPWFPALVKEPTGVSWPQYGSVAQTNLLKGF
jgi:hypothetical protein